MSSRWSDKTDFKSITDWIRKNSNGKIIITGRNPVFVDIPTLYFKFDENLNSISSLKRDKKIDSLNQKIEKDVKALKAEYFDRINLVCKKNECIVIENNNLLYSDSDHWSQQGVIYYGQKLYEEGFLDLVKK